MTDETLSSDGASPDAGPATDGDHATNGTASTVDWRRAIEDDRVRQFAERAASPADLAKIGFDLRQKLGKAVVPPGPDAGEDEIAAFRRQMGVPDTPDDYTVNRPDDLPEHLQPSDQNGALERNFLDVAHEAGLSQDQLDAVVGWYYGEVSSLDLAQRGRETETTEDMVAGLRREWGADFDGNIEHAKRAAVAFGGESFAAFVETAKADGVALGNHPSFLRTFSQIGRRIGDDTLVFGFEGAGGDAGAERHTQLTRQIHDAQEKGDLGAVERLSRERASLSERLAGDEPIVGHGGRAA